MAKPKMTKQSASAGNATALKARIKAQANPEKKTDKVIAMLKRGGGAALSDITEATGWLPHSTRAMLTGLRQKGYTIEKSKVDGMTRWSIIEIPAQ